jgi:hypothetical protein
MTSSPCLHTEEVASRIAIHGSRLVLCRVCWAVIDPLTPNAPLRLPAPQAIPVEILASPELVILESLPPKASPLPEEFGIPVPRRRLTSRFRQVRTFILTLVVALLIVLWALRFYDLHYPQFQEYLDPTRQYAVLFPGTPTWSGGSAGGGSNGEVVRNIAGLSETYGIQVTGVNTSWRFGRVKNLNSWTLAQTIMSSDAPTVVRPRTDILIAAAAEYERSMAMKLVVVGRILIVNEFAYEMTISGQDLSLDDVRVQRFFNSFQRGPWPRW